MRCERATEEDTWRNTTGGRDERDNGLAGGRLTWKELRHMAGEWMMRWKGTTWTKEGRMDG
jgi:hypothetical protein